MSTGLSVHGSQIEAMLINQGYPVMMQEYAALPQYYDTFMSVDRAPYAALAARYGDFPYGYKHGSLLGLGQPIEIEIGQEIPATTMTTGYTPQFKVRKISQRVTFAREDYTKRNGMAEVGDTLQILMGQWGKTFGARKNQIAADILQKGTLSAGHAETFKNGYRGRSAVDGKIYDGVSFFNAAHPQDDGSGATYSNITASLAFSQANLQTVIQTMRSTNGFDGRGERIDINPRLLIIPPVLEFDAYQILQSAQLAGTANNDANPLLNRLTPVVNPYLTDDAATAAGAGWWVIAPDLSGIKVLDTGDPVPEVFEDPLNQSITVSVTSYFGVGVMDWRCAYAANKATS